MYSVFGWTLVGLTVRTTRNLDDECVKVFSADSRSGSIERRFAIRAAISVIVCLNGAERVRVSKHKGPMPRLPHAMTHRPWKLPPHRPVCLFLFVTARRLCLDTTCSQAVYTMTATMKKIIEMQPRVSTLQDGSSVFFFVDVSCSTLSLHLGRHHSS